VSGTTGSEGKGTNKNRRKDNQTSSDRLSGRESGHRGTKPWLIKMASPADSCGSEPCPEEETKAPAMKADFVSKHRSASTGRKGEKKTRGRKICGGHGRHFWGGGLMKQKLKSMKRFQGEGSWRAVVGISGGEAQEDRVATQEGESGVAGSLASRRRP